MSSVVETLATANRVYQALAVVTDAARYLKASIVMVDDRSVYVVAPHQHAADQWRDRFGDHIGGVRLHVAPAVVEGSAS